VSGGDSSLGTGGDAGTIFMAFGEGRLVPDAGHARPGINANFLTPAVLADSTVSYTELSTIDPAAFSATSTQAFLALRGQDFHLPAGITLDLGDAPAGITGLFIDAYFAGDVVRIDGTVVTARSTGMPLGFVVRVHQSSGNALSVDGTIDCRPIEAGV